MLIAISLLLAAIPLRGMSAPQILQTIKIL